MNLKLMDKYSRYFLIVTDWVLLLFILPLTSDKLERKTLLKLSGINFLIWIVIILLFGEIPKIYIDISVKLFMTYIMIKIFSFLIIWIRND